MDSRRVNGVGRRGFLKDDPRLVGQVLGPCNCDSVIFKMKCVSLLPNRMAISVEKKRYWIDAGWLSHDSV